MTTLNNEQRRLLRWISKQQGLVCGGIYETGKDTDVAVLAERGLIEPVRRTYSVGRATFSGGYRITDAGRRIADAMLAERAKP